MSLYSVFELSAFITASLFVPIAFFIRVVLSNLISGGVCIAVFFWFFKRPTSKTDQVTLARLCTLFFAIFFIAVGVFIPATSRSFEEGLYLVTISFIIGIFKLFVFYSLTRLSFDLAGAVVRNKPKKEKDRILEQKPEKKRDKKPDKKPDKTDIRFLLLISLLFLVNLYLVFELLIFASLSFSLPIIFVLLAVLLSFVPGGICVSVFVWALGRPTNKRDQLVMARFCTLLLAVLVIILRLFMPETLRSFTEEVYHIVIFVLIGGFYLFLFHGFARLSFDLAGAVARKKFKKETD